MRKLIIFMLIFIMSMCPITFQLISNADNKISSVIDINNSDVSVKHKVALASSDADTGSTIKESNNGAPQNEPNNSVLPGHNTYFNGFERLTNLTYDDVATVTDSKYTFSIGTYFDEDYYMEEQISYSHLGGGPIINGCSCLYYYYGYEDIHISVTTFNPISNDYSGEQYYISGLELRTPRFQTTKGIHVGSTIDEMFEAYDTDGYKNIDETVDESYDKPCYSLRIDGVDISFFYDKDTNKITNINLRYGND